MRIKTFERTYDEKNYGDMVDFLNSVFQNGITIDNNFAGQIVQISMPAGPVEVRVNHRLGVVPKYRIILRQDTEQVLADGDETWNDKYVTFKSTAGNCNFTVLLLK